MNAETKAVIKMDIHIEITPEDLTGMHPEALDKLLQSIGYLIQLETCEKDLEKIEQRLLESKKRWEEVKVRLEEIRAEAANPPPPCKCMGVVG